MLHDEPGVEHSSAVLLLYETSFGGEDIDEWWQALLMSPFYGTQSAILHSFWESLTFEFLFSTFLWEIWNFYMRSLNCTSSISRYVVIPTRMVKSEFMCPFGMSLSHQQHRERKNTITSPCPCLSYCIWQTWGDIGLWSLLPRLWLSSQYSNNALHFVSLLICHAVPKGKQSTHVCVTQTAGQPSLSWLDE